MVSGTTTTWRDYIVADGQIVALRSKTGASVSMLYIVTDHLGSTAAVTDTATPMGVERDGYDAWGHRRNINGTPDPSCTLTSQTNRGYTGQEMLDSQCLINMNARVYDPTLARFQSADSVVPNPIYGQAYNRYAYAYGNPLNAVDPSGHADETVEGETQYWNIGSEFMTGWAAADFLSMSFGGNGGYTDGRGYGLLNSALTKNTLQTAIIGPFPGLGSDWAEGLYGIISTTMYGFGLVSGGSSDKAQPVRYTARLKPACNKALMSVGNLLTYSGKNFEKSV